MDVVRVAVVGLGVTAQVVYLPLLARRRDIFQVSAVCDLDREHAETVGRELGATAFDDPVAMLDGGGFDALIVLTRGSHGPIVKPALDRGYWVLTENPLAYSLAELEGVPTDARLMVAYMKQYDPAAHRMLEALHEVGGPAAIRHLDVTVLQPSEESQLLFARARVTRPPADRLAPYAEADELALTAAVGTASERLRRLYARVVLGSVCHELSLMRMFTVPPDTVDHVAVWPVDAFPPSIEVSGTLRGGGSARYGIRLHHLPSYPAYHETVRVHHDHGSLELHYPSPYLLNAPTALSCLSRVGTTERRTVYRDVAEPFERQLVAFHRFVTQEEPPLTGLEAAMEDIVIAQRIIRRYAEWAGIPVSGECVRKSERTREPLTEPLGRPLG
ncbi:Gfo/Idh/MocA family protein [Planotetraspora kaengkrachanensis]|uniref:Gfo/Idh/MocA family protein n=1 Tax=Planotetraspora kaengkrachanensis TaxID=575193 RepID=UPI001EF22AF2|nr:Gfo/Idh/MocA family oxidoreductase [Planotetraspora kaengkrachanensis]